MCWSTSRVSRSVGSIDGQCRSSWRCVLLLQLYFNEFVATVGQVLQTNRSHSLHQGHIVDKIMLEAKGHLHRLFGIKCRLRRLLSLRALVDRTQQVIETLPNHPPLALGD